MVCRKKGACLRKWPTWLNKLLVGFIYKVNGYKTLGFGPYVLSYIRQPIYAHKCMYLHLSLCASRFLYTLCARLMDEVFLYFSNICTYKHIVSILQFYTGFALVIYVMCAAEGGWWLRTYTE